MCRPIRHFDPHRRGTAAGGSPHDALGVSFATSAARAASISTFAVATEKIADFRPRDPDLTGLPERGGDHIFGFSGSNTAENVDR